MATAHASCSRLAANMYTASLLPLAPSLLCDKRSLRPSISHAGALSQPLDSSEERLTSSTEWSSLSAERHQADLAGQLSARPPEGNLKGALNCS